MLLMYTFQFPLQLKKHTICDIPINRLRVMLISYTGPKISHFIQRQKNTISYLI